MAHFGRHCLIPCLVLSLKEPPKKFTEKPPISLSVLHLSLFFLLFFFTVSVCSMLGSVIKNKKSSQVYLVRAVESRFCANDVQRLEKVATSVPLT